MTDDELLDEIEALRLMMISVSTGGRASSWESIERRERIAAEFRARGLDDPNRYENLELWRAKWSSGDLPRWDSRRRYVTGLYSPIIEAIKARRPLGGAVFPEPTGWAKVDGMLSEIRLRLEQAKTEEQFQAVGLLCRETLISLAQLVHDPVRHPSLDGVTPSDTDAKRRLEAYLAVELGGSSHEAARKHARAALDLANDLQHRRTAAFRQAALCAEATTSVVNLVAVVSGQ